MSLHLIHQNSGKQNFENVGQIGGQKEKASCRVAPQLNRGPFGEDRRKVKRFQHDDKMSSLPINERTQLKFF